MSGFKGADDYVDVATRIAKFYEKYPDGSLQAEVYELSESRVVMRAYAYRDREDAKPSVAHSVLAIPGSTNFTRGSEIENAETSAVGRAIALLGFEVKKGIASREEVRNKQSDDSTPNTPRQASPSPVGGSVSLAGKVAIGNGNGMDLELREDAKDGPAIGFKLVEVEGYPRGKKSTGVRAFGPLAVAVAAHARELPGQKVVLTGTLRPERIEAKGDKPAINYEVVILETMDAPDFTVPAEAPSEPMFPPPSSADLSDLDSLPW